MVPVYTIASARHGITDQAIFKRGFLDIGGQT